MKGQIQQYPIQSWIGYCSLPWRAKVDACKKACKTRLVSKPAVQHLVDADLQEPHDRLN